MEVLKTNHKPKPKIRNLDNQAHFATYIDSRGIEYIELKLYVDDGETLVTSDIFYDQKVARNFATLWVAHEVEGMEN